MSKSRTTRAVWTDLLAGGAAVAALAPLLALPALLVPSPAVLAVLLVLALIAGIAAVARRSWWPGVVGAVCLLSVVLFLLDTLVLERDALLEGPTASEGRANAAPPERIRVVGFNVLHGYSSFPDQEARAARAIAALRALEPDVVVLQEAWRTREHGNFVQQLATALDMDWAFARANGRLERIGFEEGEAVLSRFPIVAAERIPVAPRRPWYERRVALFCSLDLGGETLTVVGVHLDHRRDATAIAQSADLVRLVGARRPTLVAGDFNEPSESAALGHWVERGYLDLMPGGIDHVLLDSTGSWQATGARWALEPSAQASLDPRHEFSDHPAIVVDLIRRR